LRQENHYIIYNKDNIEEINPKKYLHIYNLYQPEGDIKQTNGKMSQNICVQPD